MKTDELGELECEIAKNVMGWTLVKSSLAPKYLILSDLEKVQEHGNWKKPNGAEIRVASFHPSTDPAAALEVLKKCAEKMKELHKEDRSIAIHLDGFHYVVMETDIANGIRAEAPTLELAICLFSKELFNPRK